MEGPREGKRLRGGEGSGTVAPAPRGEVRIFAGPAELMRAAAEEVIAALSRRGGHGPPRAVTPPFPSLVLSGGSTPRGLYRLLADPAAPFRARLAWDAIHFFWGDERHVPPDHPGSNYRMAREAMLEHVPVPAAHVHRIAGEEPDAARAAAAYERELVTTFGLRRKERDAAASGLDWPRFDLVLLGLGEEGHTASLFPGSPLLAESRRLAAAVWVEKLHTWRITLTPPVLVRAAAVIFLVSGAAKAAALAAVVEGEPRPELYPAQVVVPVDGRLLWLVDEAAATRLRSGRRG